MCCVIPLLTVKAERMKIDITELDRHRIRISQYDRITVVIKSDDNGALYSEGNTNHCAG